MPSEVLDACGVKLTRSVYALHQVTEALLSAIILKIGIGGDVGSGEWEEMGRGIFIYLDIAGIVRGDSPDQSRRKRRDGRVEAA